jgi:hypothetical protein
VRIDRHGVLWDGHAAACSQAGCGWAMTLEEAHTSKLNLAHAVAKHLRGHGIAAARVDLV